MLSKPEISVIIPTYNRAELLKKAISSVLNQTFEDLELIIVDEASTDNTSEVVKDFMEGDNRIKYLRYKTNSGKPSIARNRGIAAAEGEYLAFLDSDDEWLPKKLEMQIKMAKNFDLDVVGCNYFLVDENGETIGKVTFPEWIRKNLLKGLMEGAFYPNLSGLLIKKHALKEWFDGNLTWGEDLELVIRLIKNNAKFDFVKNACFRYTIHTNRISNRLDWIKKARDYEYIALKHREFLEKYPKEYSELLRWIARAYCYSGMIKKGREYYRESIKFNSANYKSFMGYIASLGGYRSFQILSKAYKMFKV